MKINFQLRVSRNFAPDFKTQFNKTHRLATKEPHLKTLIFVLCIFKAKIEENFRKLYYYMGETALCIAKRRIVSTNFKGKGKSEKRC